MKFQTPLTVARYSVKNPPPEGSVLFTQNGLPRFLDRMLEWVTGSQLSHTMIFLRCKGVPFIYEAYPPKVHKISWRHFVGTTIPERESRFWTRRLGGLQQLWWVPREPFASYVLKAMRAKAEEGLGVKYSMVWNWWREDCPKLHCSEYGAGIFEAGNVLESAGGRETPGSFYAKLLASGL